MPLLHAQAGFPMTLFSAHRRILVDWLNDVQGEYNLSLQTLHTAVQLVDRALIAGEAHS